MDFYNCPYVNVVPFRNGNEYDETYRCGITESNCKCCACDVPPERVELVELLKNYTESCNLEELISNERLVQETINGLQESGAIDWVAARNYRELVLQKFWSCGLYKLFPMEEYDQNNEHGGKRHG